MDPTKPSTKPPAASSPRHPSTKSKRLDVKKTITIPQLQKLESYFSLGPLSESEFVQRFQQVIPDLTEDAASTLFLQIDANADGQVSWEEVTSFMFVHAADACEISNSSDSTSEEQLSREKFVKANNLHHRSNPKDHFDHRRQIVKIVYLDAGRGSYLTASLDGTVRKWSSNWVYPALLHFL